MLTAECYKQRLEKGLTFLEFNYMIMQGYDFLELFHRYGCTLQTGGDDQWSNILAGADLIRRKEGKGRLRAHLRSCCSTSEGNKMGKTAKGALWLDPKKTSRPTSSTSTGAISPTRTSKRRSRCSPSCPMDEVRRLGALPGSEINEAKRVLAYEVTKLIHGETEAENARQAAESLFGDAGLAGSVPTTEITEAELASDARLISLISKCGMCKSNGEARKTLQQGGVTIGEEKITDPDFLVTKEMLSGEGIIVRKGKKTYHRFVLKV